MTREPEDLPVMLTRAGLRAEVERLTTKNALLLDYALHMQGLYRAYREHFGTEGVYPRDDSVAKLTAALETKP